MEIGKWKSGRTYWKSLEEQANSPDFRARVEREFPVLAMELEAAPPGTSRRKFLQLVGASLALAGVGAVNGCRRDDHRIMPYQHKSAEQVPGNPIYYATTFVMAGVTMGVLVKTVDGRPIKIEGNPNHPNSGGATNAWAQASILDLYDPDRSREVKHNGQTATRTAFLRHLDDLAGDCKANKGNGLAILSEDHASPSIDMLRGHIAQTLPEASWHTYEPASRRGAYEVRYRLDQANVILSLDCDLLGWEDDGVRHKREFAAGRKAPAPMNRLYVLEPTWTVTGAAADHRWSASAGEIEQFARQLAVELTVLPAPAKEMPADPRIKAIARDLLANRGRCVVAVGARHPSLQALAWRINDTLGNLPDAVDFRYPYPPRQDKATKSNGFAPNMVELAELADRIRAGRVRTILVLGGNPAYAAPADLEFDKLLAQVPNRIRLGFWEDETSALCDWHVPAAHYLESWGDAGDIRQNSLIQPMIEPLFGGFSPLELLSRISGYKTTDPYAIVRERFFRDAPGQGDTLWRKQLNEGAVSVSVEQRIAEMPPAFNDLQVLHKPASADRLDVWFAPSCGAFDGRFANNGWLQEMPDPITNLTWDNAAIISPRLAVEKALSTGDVATISVNGRTLDAPVMVLPGQGDWSVTLPLGYGRTRAGSLGTGTGFNACRLQESDSPGFAVGATITKTGRTYPLATTQEHWSIAEHHILDEQLKQRAIIREGTLEQYRSDPEFARHMGEAHAPTNDDISANPLDEFKKDPTLHQWAMTIDMSACVGCSACVIACQAENNVPIVGKDEVIRGREMHWMRIDRYFSGSVDPSGPNQAGHAPLRIQMQPMLCQHCEAAPCEPVCPVNATVHDSEGLNAMVYNRCVGTRYCSNNCPYKVRRFNYFDWNKGTIRESGKAPFDGQIQPDPRKGFSLPQIAQPPMQELLKMQKNPDVTVRMRGVMEKCTFCVQRIESAKIASRVAAGDKPPAKVPDGTIQTACQQSCPTQAIVFGDQSDPGSRVAKLRASERAYAVLEHLNTKPRIGYLARITNPNPALAASLAGRVGHGNSSEAHP